MGRATCAGGCQDAALPAQPKRGPHVAGGLVPVAMIWQPAGPFAGAPATPTQPACEDQPASPQLLNSALHPALSLSDPAGSGTLSGSTSCAAAPAALTPASSADGWTFRALAQGGSALSEAPMFSVGEVDKMLQVRAACVGGRVSLRYVSRRMLGVLTALRISQPPALTPCLRPARSRPPSAPRAQDMYGELERNDESHWDCFSMLQDASERCLPLI